jgi:hypothetical protein
MVTELTDLVAAHPVRERLVAALMRALVTAGRDSETLRVYRRARESLADALGVDPSPELSALHIALLRGELGRREESRKTNLRAELTTFVGRGADVAAVRELTAGAGPGPAPRLPAMQIACEAYWVGGGLVGLQLAFGRRTMLSVDAGTTVYVVLLNACA